MNRLSTAVTVLAAQLLLVTGAAAQSMAAQPNAPAATDGYPSGVKLQKGPNGWVFADPQGHLLYASDPRAQQLVDGAQGGGQCVRAQGGAGQAGGGLRGAGQGGFNCNGTCPPDYCTDTCSADWAPLVAPADAVPVGRWRVVKGPEGPQWTINGAFVFVPKGGTKKTYQTPSTIGGAFDLSGDGMWKKIPYVPPAPKLVAPIGIKPVYVGTAYSYVLADAKGHALFSAPGGRCKACTDWTPLSAGVAAQGMGDWTIARDGDRPQWVYRGKPVYVSQEEKPIDVPATGIALRP